MARILGLGLVLWLLVQSGASADTAYLRGGQSIWGRDIYEEGDEIVIVRPSGPVRVPKAEVTRIERLRTTLPRHYSPPSPPVAAAPAPSPVPTRDARPAPAPDAPPPPTAASPASLGPGPAPPGALPRPPSPPARTQ